MKYNSKINKLVKFAIIILSLAILSIILVSCGVDKNTKLIKIDYTNMVIVGSSLKDFSKMFDEQNTLDPSCYIDRNPQTVQATLDHDATGQQSLNCQYIEPIQ